MPPAYLSSCHLRCRRILRDVGHDRDNETKSEAVANDNSAFLSHLPVRRYYYSIPIACV
jgi:hypothetical protein